MAFNWTCPHCDRDQSVTDSHVRQFSSHIGFKDLAEGSVGFHTVAIMCANSTCKKLTFHLAIRNEVHDGHVWVQEDGKKPIFSERLIPRGAIKPQPTYIPQAIRDDYTEACLVKDLSPKAAATLARRALQGMIRDFCGIVKGTLDQEIKALDAAVTDRTADRAISVESVQAIDHVRKVGNIGAHMEKDINIIVDVGPDEAGVLIELVEMLLKDWYVERHKRGERLAALAAISEQKAQAKLGSPSDQGALPPP